MKAQYVNRRSRLKIAVGSVGNVGNIFLASKLVARLTWVIDQRAPPARRGLTGALRLCWPDTARVAIASVQSL